MFKFNSYNNIMSNLYIIFLIFRSKCVFFWGVARPVSPLHAKIYKRCAWVRGVEGGRVLLVLFVWKGLVIIVYMENFLKILFFRFAYISRSHGTQFATFFWLIKVKGFSHRTVDMAIIIEMREKEKERKVL